MAATFSAALERRPLGILLRTGSASLFALMATCLKAASLLGVSTAEMIFYRNLTAVPVVLGWVLLGPGLATLRTRRPMAQLTRSAIGTFAMLCTYGAIVLLPLGEATTLTYSAPVLATILSGLFLGERIGLRRGAAVAVGFVGVLLVARPGTHGAAPLAGILVAILAALGQSAVMITLRQISRTEHVEATTFWYTVFAAVVGALAMPFFAHWRDGPTMLILLGAGLFGGLAQLMMTGSLRFAPVSVVAPFDYLQIIWATLIGWLVFADVPVATTIAGAALIAASGLYTAYRERQRGQVPAQGLAPPEL